MKAFVPLLAMVPRLFTRSALVIPIPVSWMVRVFFSLSAMRVIPKSLPESSLLGSVRLSYRILSKAWVEGTAEEGENNLSQNAPTIYTAMNPPRAHETYIGGVGNQFTKENLLVAIEGVDNQAHQLSDFSLKGEGFDLFVSHG